MKKLNFSVIHIILVLLVFLYEAISAQQPLEIIPYRFVPAGDLSCWVDIEIVEPVSIQALIGIHKEEVIEIIKERVGFELVNPMEQSQLFSIDDKLYYLVKLPYDYSSHWVDRGTKYGRN